MTVKLSGICRKQQRLNFYCRAPREITALNIHQAISSVPTCDFLTNAHMGSLLKDN